jgi:hypothetical protein
MPKIARAAGLVLLGILSGCGGGAPSTSNAGPPPPHQGNLTAMPGGKGNVEVVQKKAESSKTPLTGEVSFYFLKDDGSPFSPAPSSGTLTVGKKKITLQAQGDALATPNGPPLFPKGGLDGELTVELDGKSVTIPLGIR